MAEQLTLPDPDLHALAAGTVIVAFAPRHAVDLNDELALVPGGPRSAVDLAAVHHALLNAGPPPRDLTGLVVGLQPAASLAGAGGAPHHILVEAPEGDAVILRVFASGRTVLPEREFDAMRAVVEAMFS